MRKVILIIKHWSHYRYWRIKSKGIKTKDHDRGVGYYLPHPLVISLGGNTDPVTWETEMKSGKTGVYELVSSEFFSDPWDMVKSSKWNLIGYKGVKPIADCSFSEFIDLYVKK
jgi:hypothetical protein